MEATHIEHIPNTKPAVQPSNFEHNEDDDEGQGPSVSTQPIINQTVTNSTTNITTVRTNSSNTYSLELPVLLLFFSWNLSGTVFQNQVLYQSCILNYNESTCNLLANEDIPDDLEVSYFENDFF